MAPQDLQTKIVTATMGAFNTCMGPPLCEPCSVEDTPLAQDVERDDDERVRAIEEPQARAVDAEGHLVPVHLVLRLPS